MKKKLILFLILGGVGCLWIFYPTQELKNSLKVKAENPILDLGTINKDTLESNVVKAIFKVKNISSDNLIIEDVYTVCKPCTLVDYTTDIIKPNTWFYITGEFKDLSPGYFEQNLRVSFRESASSPLLLVFRGKIL